MKYMADNESEARTHSETLDTKVTPETMDKFTAYREENGLEESEAARRLIRTELNRDRRAERAGITRLTAGFGSFLLSLYFWFSSDTFAAGTAVYMGTVLIWTRYPSLGRWL